jgi:hypothetical protein
LGPWNWLDVWLSAANADTENSVAIIRNNERVSFFIFVFFSSYLRFVVRTTRSGESLTIRGALPIGVELVGC